MKANVVVRSDTRDASRSEDVPRGDCDSAPLVFRRDLGVIGEVTQGDEIEGKLRRSRRGHSSPTTWFLQSPTAAGGCVRVARVDKSEAGRRAAERVSGFRIGEGSDRRPPPIVVGHWVASGFRPRGRWVPSTRGDQLPLDAVRPPAQQFGWARPRTGLPLRARSAPRSSRLPRGPAIPVRPQ